MQPQTYPPTENKPRSLSIRTYLILGVGSVLALVALLTFTSSLSISRLQTGIQTTLDTATRLRDLALSFQNQFLLARQYEADFLSHVRMQAYDEAANALVEANANSLSEARTLLDEIGLLVQNSQDPALRTLVVEIETLQPLLEEYETAFRASAGYYEERGRPEGSSSQLRDILARFEKAFGPLDNPAYLMRVLKIRANEQAYYATGRQEFIDNIHLLTGQLSDMLKAIPPAEQELLLQTPESLIAEAEGYLTTFDLITILDRNAQINTIVFQEVTADIIQVIGQVDEKTSLGLEQSTQSLSALRFQTTLVIGLAGIATLVMGTIVAALSIRNITGPLNTLRQAAEKLGLGELNERVQVRRGAELITLADTFNGMADQLQQTLGSLEQRVAERTRELELRSAQLQAAAEIARDATSIRELGSLLNRAVSLVRERFGFYHSGIFLVDEAGEFAVLQAATGEAGRILLERNHKLKIGEVGMVGNVAHSGQPRIASDVGADATYFRNPLLPDTHSEMSLPLKVGTKVIGVLDIQSQKTSAFTQEDITVLSIVADQLAVAIDNIRLVKESQENVQQLESLYGRFSEESWERLGESSPTVGYRYDHSGLAPIPRNEPLQSDSPTLPLPGITVPLKIRGQTIASLDLWPERGETLAENRIILEAIGERISQALDSARVFEETQNRAAREQALNQLVARLTSSLDLDTLLQTAAHELSNIPGVSEVSIHVGASESLPSGAN